MEPIGFVVIFSVADAAPRTLRQYLLKQKYESKSVKSTAEAQRIKAKWGEVVTVVCFGEAQDEGLVLLKKLLADTSYHSLPLLVVGEEAETIKPELEKVFSLVGALHSMSTASEIAIEIELLWGEYEKRKDDARKAAEHTFTDEVNAPRHSTPASNEMEPAARSITEDYFARLATLNLLGETVGGSFLARTSKNTNYVSRLNTMGVGLAEAYEKSMGAADSWIKGHALRVAYTTHSILTALGFSVEQVLTTTRAALWHPLAFRSNRRLARGSYMKSRAAEYRNKVARAVRDSATKISYEYKAPTEGLTIGLFSRIIGQDEVTHGSEESTQAYALYVADVIDRVCCSDGYFNPQKGYQLLGDIKQGAFNEVEPSIAVVAIKFLSEALVGAPPKMAMPAAILRAYRKRLAEGGVDAIKPNSDEKKIPINKLAPGMTLSRPLCTFDGREVLAPSLKLDEDLIMRVWQLTAIRPLEPAIVRRESMLPTQKN